MTNREIREARIRKDIDALQQKIESVEAEWDKARDSYEIDDPTPEQQAFTAKQQARRKKRAKKAFVRVGGDPDGFEEEWPTIQLARREEAVIQALVKEMKSTKRRRVSL